MEAAPAEGVMGLDEVTANEKAIPETVTLSLEDGKAIATLPFRCVKNCKMILGAIDMERHRAPRDKWENLCIKIGDAPEHAIRDAAKILEAYDGSVPVLEAKQPRRTDLPGSLRGLLEPYESSKRMTRVRDLVLLANRLDEPVLLNHTCAFVATAIRGLLPQGIDAVLSDRMTPEEARKAYDGISSDA